MARLFVAVWLPEDVVADLTALPRKDQRGVRFVPPANWHVTLRFLGNADPREVADALDAAILPSAHARVGPGVDVLSDRAVVVPVTGLDDLARAVVERTRDVGDPPRKRFNGHVTLARLKRHAIALPPAMGAFVTGEFDVREVALVQSRLESSGARYETLCTWDVPAS